MTHLRVPVLLASLATVLAAQDGVRTTLDLPYAEGVAKDGRRNALDLYLPPAAVGVKPPLVVCVHGGAWSAGSKDLFAPLGAVLARDGFACAAINTRMFPFARPDAMVEDCAHAVGYLHAHADELGFDGDAIVLLGHSAGGHLVAWLGLDEAAWQQTGVPRACLRGVVGLSGVYDVRPQNVVLDRVFAGPEGFRDTASPVLHAGPSAPPFLLLWGEKDIPGLSLGARMLAHRLRTAGVPVAGGQLAARTHVDYVFQLARPGSRELPGIERFVRERTAAVPAAAPTVPAAAAAPRAVQRTTDALAGAGAPVELVVPADGAAGWFVLAVDAASRIACGELAADLAAAGAAVALVDCAGFGAEPGEAGMRAFAAVVDRLTAEHAQLGLPALAPVVAGTGAAGFLVATLQAKVAGKVLLGAAAGASAGTALHARTRGADLFARNQAPVLLLLGLDDGQGPLGRAEPLAALLSRPQDCVIRLPQVAIADLLGAAASRAATIVPLLGALLE